MPNQPKTPNRVIRVDATTWDAYGQVCAAEGTKRSDDLRAHMQRRIRAYLRRGGTMTTNPAADDA